ncbi:MAG: iron complex outermembrane receptor protein [Paraglaciecola psychrophila]|jgi:iron complex outermembrane receptor protein
MFNRNALFSAIVAASTVSSVSFAQIEEVMVTATKRSASTQDIPVSVTAMSQESLEDMGVTNFSDYLIQLPGVTAGGSGPGQNTIYIRGVASTTPHLTTAGVAGLAPNVALYLDEQPLSQPGRNLDVYAADLERIEVLSGPQGTLFGASAQAGTVRLITNKPDQSGLYGKIKAGTAYTDGGDNSYNLEAMINIPVNDRLAVRAVIYSDKQGGYIDNVAGAIDASESARFRPAGTVRDNGLVVSSGRGGFQAGADLSGVNFLSADNSALVEDDFNEASYTGGRISVRYDIDDTWSLLVGVSQQTLDTEGVFFVDPDLDDLEIQRYEDDTLEDSFENFNWTLEGRLGNLDVVYTGAFTEREADQIVDYTDYLFVGQYLPYYICDRSVSYPGAGNASTGTCQSPNLYVESRTETDVETHELRFATDADKSIRATFGVYYSSLEIREVNSFTYPGSTEILAVDGETKGFGPNFSAQGSSVSDQGQWPAGVIFRNDILRTDDQVAAFGEVTADLSEQFALTVGARWYDVEVDLKGSAAGSFGNLGATTDNNAGNNLDTLFTGENDTAQTDGWIGKVSLAWTPSDDQLYYATWSEGFRPGLLNRPGGKGNDVYTVPFGIDTDDVTNYEMGWKVDMLDGLLRFNGSVFFVEVERMQTGIFDPSIANLFFVSNAADAQVKGLDASFVWAPYSFDGLTVNGAVSYLDTKVTKVLIPTDDVIKGSELAFAPTIQANLQARYEWSLDSGMVAHVMPHVAYSESAYTDIITINRSEVDSWLMVGFSAGVSNDDWSAELYVDNITDERAEVSGSFTFDRERITTSRPRTAGLRVSYNF